MDADHNVRCPKKTSFTRFLHGVDGDTIERVLLWWRDQLLGPTQHRLIIVDAKKVRHGGVEIVNAVDGAGRFLGSVVTPAKTNEIPAARQLLRPQNLIGKTVIGDALHTQTETAQQILYEQGGGYLLTVKGNQKTLQETLESLFNAAVDGARANNPKTMHNTRTFQQPFRSARGGRERLRALIFPKCPDILDL